MTDDKRRTPEGEDWEEDTPIVVPPDATPVEAPSARQHSSARAAFRAINGLRRDFREHADADQRALADLDKKLDEKYASLEKKIDDRLAQVAESHNGLAREVSGLAGSFQTFVEESRSAKLVDAKRAETQNEASTRVEITRHKWTILEKIVAGIFAVAAVLIPILAAKC